ncbi:MAG: glycosyltransferase [Bryobacteraceae bacterium]
MECFRPPALVRAPASVRLKAVRVLHIVPSFYPAVHYGGPIYSVLHLCLNLRRLGCEVKVLTTDANGNSRLTAEQQGDPILDPLKPRFCRRIGRGMVAPGLARRLPAEAAWADVIHLTGVYNFPTFPTLVATSLCRKPLVWSPRGALQRWKGSRHVFAKAVWESLCCNLLPRRTTLHVTSEEESAGNSQRLGTTPSCLIRNGVDIPPLAPPLSNDGVLKLLFIGRLDPVKGIENLIVATSIAARAGMGKWRLRVAGTGDPGFVAHLRGLIHRAGIASQVEFCGHVEGEDKYREFAASDVVVVPSHTENFGLVVAEALAHARPVITSRGTPWREVEQHQCGLWVENDPGSLATAIGRINQCDRFAMGQRGREWMRTDFCWLERARRMLSLYEQLVRT